LFAIAVKEMMGLAIKDLLTNGPIVVNIGIEQFYHDLKKQDAKVVHVDWRPSALKSDLLSKLRKLREGGAN